MLNHQNLEIIIQITINFYINQTLLLKMQEQLENEGEQQQCSNCLKHFPVDKIDLHEAYCCRNIRKCTQCSAMIDIKDMEDHIAQEHTKKPCSYCPEQFEPAEIAKHQTQCPQRPIICKFCENQHAFIDLGRHEEVCGARTQACSICHKLVSLKDLQGHESRCARRREERRDQRRQQRNEISQDNNYRRPIIDRQRQNSTNNLANHRSNSIQNQNKPIKHHKIKPTNIIGPETIKPSIDPIPISVRLAMRGGVPAINRNPLKSKN